MTTDLPAPLPSPDGTHYWAAAAEDRFELQYCEACGSYQFPPGHLCRNCGADGLTWRAASGRGHIHTFSIVHRAPLPAFRAHVPYVVALIDLAEGPRMMSQILDADPEALAVGLSVSVDFAAWSEDITLPVFRLGPVRNSAAT